jgi:hypothetical protein
MPKPEVPADQLRKKAKVVAVEDLRDVPAGTPGRVILVDGFTWIRYWVQFDNGVDLGSISRAQLATADEWARHLSGDLVLGGTSAGAGDGAAADSDADGDADADGGKATPSGTLVPQKLLDRSSAARARLAA